MKKYFPNYEKCIMEEEQFGYVKEEELTPLIMNLLDVQEMRSKTGKADAARVAHNRAVRKLRSLINSA